MEDFWLYVHLVFLSIAIAGIVMADKLAFAWMRGKKPLLERRDLERSHWAVTIGLAGLVYTGLYLFWPMRDYLLDQPAFLAKMLFVFALLINSFFIEALLPHATISTHANLKPAQRQKLMLSGGISGVSWFGAIVMAVYLFGWPF